MNDGARIGHDSVLSLWKGRIIFSQTMAGILAEVAEQYGLTVVDLKGPARYRHIAWPRQEAMARMARCQRSDGKRVFSLPQIGRFLNRDHTTVLWGIRRHEERMRAS